MFDEGLNISGHIGYRDKAIDMVEDGLVTKDHMILMCLKWMSNDDVAEMLDANELSERFFENDGEED